jgi:hypothetical protein
MTSIERTAYPQFPRLMTAKELHVFYTPAPDEAVWAQERTNADEGSSRGGTALIFDRLLSGRTYPKSHAPCERPRMLSASGACCRLLLFAVTVAVSSAP